MLEFTTSTNGKIAAGVCVGVTVLMSTVLVMQHLMNYTHPIMQRYAIRIILMVPVYAVDSYLALWLPNYAFYINALRDVYEAYVIYNFVAMCLCYVGGSAQLVSMWQEDNAVIPGSWITGTCCVRGIVLNQFVLRRCIQGVLQYVIVKLVTTVAAFICELVGVLNEGSLSPKYAYLYICLLMNGSVMLALFSLLVFALSTKKYLKPFQPLLKFTALKLIIFVTWWQYIAISVMVAVGVIKASDDDEKTKGEIAMELQDWLMCVEVLPFAILMFVAYPARLIVDKDDDDLAMGGKAGKHSDTDTLELGENSSSAGDFEMVKGGEKGSGGGAKAGAGGGKDVEIVRQRRVKTKAGKNRSGFFENFRHALAVKDIIDDTRTYTDYQYKDFASLGREGDNMDDDDDDNAMRLGTSGGYDAYNSARFHASGFATFPEPSSPSGMTPAPHVPAAAVAPAPSSARDETTTDGPKKDAPAGSNE